MVTRGLAVSAEGRIDDFVPFARRQSGHGQPEHGGSQGERAGTADRVDLCHGECTHG